MSNILYYILVYFYFDKYFSNSIEIFETNREKFYIFSN